MKACPECGRLYNETAGFCPVDGQSLLPLDQVPVKGDDPRLGQLVAGRYLIRRVVADGGMGRVYEAHDRQADRRVAVKMLHADVASDSVAVARFKREFQVSSQLPHQHIIEVLDFQQDAGTYALVMEFLDGEELRTFLQRDKTASPGRVVRMVSQLAIGLDAAHAQRFVHRDLKPDNVFLCGTREGDRVKILDFGSVKDKSEGAKKLTMLGTTIGSPYYMAPEQAQGLDTLDHRADVWAVAAIVYETLLGTVPFTGNNGPTILLSIMTKDPVRPTEAAQKIGRTMPPALDDVIEEAFVKNPSGRLGSVGLLADRLGAAFGLTGTHQEWAATPQDQLDARIDAAMPALLAAARAAVVGDPFAAAGGGAMTMQSARSALDDAFRQAPPVNVVALGGGGGGVPGGGDEISLPMKKGPPVAVLVAVGVLLVVGLGAVAMLMR